MQQLVSIGEWLFFYIICNLVTQSMFFFIVVVDLESKLRICYYKFV